MAGLNITVKSLFSFLFLPVSPDFDCTKNISGYVIIKVLIDAYSRASLIRNIHQKRIVVTVRTQLR